MRTAGDNQQPNGDIAVRLESITKVYGDHVAVDNISLDIEAGEFLSLLGPSGCGKTTTLRMIAGFEHPDSGSIELGGRNVVGVPPHKREVNTVFQQYALFPHLSVAENVAFGLQQRKTPRAEIAERVSEALDMVQMRKFADRKPTMLSGGQQQRVAVARALVNRPAVLLLDEPLGALDRKLREEMQLELKLLQRRLGTTFVFVTHDQAEALSMSDRIAIMRAGNIEQLGTSQDIYDRPASAYVAAFVGQQNFFDGTLDSATEMTSGLVRLAASQPSAAGDLKPGAEVRGAVRPEFVRFARSTGEPAAVNTLEASVSGFAHQGETMQYLFQANDGSTVLARQPVAARGDLELGDRVRLSWDPEHVRIFAADPDLEKVRGQIDANLSTQTIAAMGTGR